MTLASTTAAAAMRVQLGEFRREPGSLLTLVNAPFFAVVMLSITEHSGRDDLAVYALLAPVMMTALGMAVFEAGESLFRDRQAGVLEALLTTPGPLWAIVLGRVVVITAISLIGIVECWLVGALGFGVVATVPHPLVFAAALAATAFGIAAAGALMASVFVVGRNVRSFQNSLSFPLFLLGGVMVPAAMLPFGLDVASKAFFLSWATDLLRDSLTPGPVDAVAPRLLAILGLSALTLAFTSLLMRLLVHRIRGNGTVGFA
ncbi:ABC transporter permease [Glycomyces sp. NPDC046736]|uniref:ABC transporter permease n=1 Tax=Glycomyces sp. NPDC046736 TaxID=3155615 RepID=UPI00340DD215